MVNRWSVSWRENDHVSEVDFNRGSMIVREVASLMEREWLCNGGSMVMLQKWSL